MTVTNHDITGETDFMPCGKDDLIAITVKHVDEKGKDIAPVYKAQGYAISEFENFDINPKEIEGYELVSAPEKKTGWLGGGSKSYEFVFKYKKSTVKPADKTALDKAIKDAKAIENENYTDKSWKALQEAIVKAESVFNNSKATQAEVNAQRTALENAVKGLVQKDPEVDRTALKEAIAKAEAIKKGNYTDDSWNVLQNAIKAAKAILEDKDATQIQVDEQVKALENAIKALKTKPGSGKPDPENPDKPNTGKPGDGSGNGGGTVKPDSTGKPNAGSDAAPKTGDTAQPFVYVVGMLAAVGVCALVFRRKRTK